MGEFMKDHGSEPFIRPVDHRTQNRVIKTTECRIRSNTANKNIVAPGLQTRRKISGTALMEIATIGDTPDDIRAAAGAGAVPIGVVAPGPDPTASAIALREAGAATVLAAIDDLMELLP